VTRAFSTFVKDNLEAFAVAIALALVVRHFALEAFRIPSKSMMPTLLGDESHPKRSGDRILVDKGVYLWREPRRFETVVFQYPLNRLKNFIKRLVGLPDEWLRIVDGDIWTSHDEGATWSIARKPRGVQETLFFPYYPEPIESPDLFAGKTNWNYGPGWEGSERSRRFEVDAREPTELRFLPVLIPYDSDGLFGDLEPGEEGRETRSLVGDVRVRFHVKVERAGVLELTIEEHGLPHRLVLAPDGSVAIITRPDGAEHQLPLDLALADGMELDVSFANVDDTLLVDVDGDAEVSRTIEFPDPATEPYEYDEPKFPGAGPGVYRRHRITFAAEDLKATLTDIAIERDLFYSAGREDPHMVWKIPEDHFMMLGDNTRSSKDSRLWVVGEAFLRDGTKVVWEENPEDIPGQPLARRAPGGDDAVIEVKADIDGLVRRIRNGDVVDFASNVRYPFVPRDHLVGRAFAIFWPIHLWPFYKGPTRMGLIR